VNGVHTDVDTFVNGKAVAKQAEALAQLAKQLEVEEFAIDTNTDVWFKPDVGLQTVETLIVYLEQTPSAMKNAKSVLEDLRDYQTVLNHIKAKGLEWRFEMDF
jgi:hypothetical protein